MRWKMWLWTRLLLTADRLLGTHLIELELARRQRTVEKLLADMDEVNRELDAMTEDLAFHQLLLCLVELRARSERDDLNDWLRFTPHSDGDEAILDSTIACLVKPQLASIDAEPEGPGQYSYRINPDWPAIVARFADAPLARDLGTWLEDQL